MTAYARAKRLMVIGLVLIGLGLVFTVLKIGIDIRAIGDWNTAVTFVGAGISIVGARRRREVGRWASPAPEDRFI